MTRPAPPKVGLDDVTVAGARAADLETFEREDVTATAPPPGSLRALLLEAAQTDLGNAERFVAACRDLVRFDVPRQTWLCWDGTRWRPDDTGRTMRYAKRVMRRIAILALDQRDTKLLRHALASESRRRLLDCLALAGTEPAVVVTPDQLDADPYAFNVENVTLNLRTGESRDHTPGDLLTKVAPVTFDPAATCPRWEAFLDTITASDPLLIQYLQRVVGCALVGLGGLKVLFIFFGDGDNGKTTFINVLLELLGPYAKTADIKTFLTAADRLGGGQHRDDLAQLPGVRFVAAGEPPTGAKLDAALIKKLTGGDPITCRAAYGKTFTFDPVCKLVLTTNEKPQITEHTKAIWDRVTPVPFVVTIPQERIVKNYHQILAEELPGILNWALAGCLDWQREGFVEPATVTAARETYRDEMDGLVDWLGAEVIADHVAWTPTAVLHRAYMTWCIRKGIASPLNAVHFSRRLPAKATVALKVTVVRRQSMKTKGWLGIRLGENGNGPLCETLSRENSTVEPLAKALFTEIADVAVAGATLVEDLTSDCFDPPESPTEELPF